MFSGCASLTSITVGGDYDIKTIDMFPEPTSSDCWWSRKTKHWFTAEQIKDERNCTADTYLSTDPRIPSIKTHSLVLTGQIGVNFYCDLSMLTDDEKQATFMDFELCGVTTSDPFDSNHMNPSKTLYGFTCPVNVVQMAETITATLHYGDDQTVTQTYSVESYIDYVVDHSDGFSARTVELVKAIADYGCYMQPFLAANRGWTVDVDYAEISWQNTFNDDDFAEVRNAVGDYTVARHFRVSDSRQFI